jgi:hypothetical protein
MGNANEREVSKMNNCPAIEYILQNVEGENRNIPRCVINSMTRCVYDSKEVCPLYQNVVRRMRLQMCKNGRMHSDD